MVSILRKFNTIISMVFILSIAFGASAQDKKDDELSFDAEDVTKIRKSKKMDRAEGFYKKALSPTSDDPSVYFQSATIYFKQVMKKDNQDDSEEIKQRAQFYMGKSLYHMGYYSAAKNYFEKIVEQGDSHPFYKLTLKWLVSLQKKMPESAGILPLIGKYKEEYLEDKSLRKFKPQLLYYLGRYHYIAGRLNKASEFFDKVPSGSIYFLKSKIFEGITQVRLGRPGKALNRFNKILKFAQKNRNFKNIMDFVELANLSLARVYYQAGRVAVGRFSQTKKRKFALLAEKYLKFSITFYEKIPRASHNWPQSLFEESWAYFILDALLRPVFNKDYGGYQKALGNIHTLNAPFFEKFFFPETLILRAVVYFNNCRVKGAEEALAEFGSVYPPLQKGVRAIADKHKSGDEEENDSYYEYVKKIKTNKAGLTPILSRMVKSVLNDRTFERRVEFIAELTREINQLDAADKSWKSSDIAREIKEDLEFQKSTAETSAGKLARKRVLRLDDDLTKLVLQYGDVKIEIDNLKLKKVSAKAMVGKSPKVKVLGVTVDDEHVIWPFTGAYWQDELGYYRFVVRSSCGKGK
jgi:tetratricopeptide (TPR) repeat protein